LDVPLNKYLTEVEVHDAISRLVYRGEISNMTDGLSLARQILTEESYGLDWDTLRTIVVITAGSPDDPISIKTEVDEIKDYDIRLMTVGFGTKVSGSRF